MSELVGEGHNTNHRWRYVFFQVHDDCARIGRGTLMIPSLKASFVAYPWCVVERKFAFLVFSLITMDDGATKKWPLLIFPSLPDQFVQKIKLLSFIPLKYWLSYFSSCLGFLKIVLFSNFLCFWSLECGKWENLLTDCAADPVLRMRDFWLKLLCKTIFSAK